MIKNLLIISLNSTKAFCDYWYILRNYRKQLTYKK